MATHWTPGYDAADPHRLAAFWASALGYVAEPGYDDPDGASIIDPAGVGPAIGFLKVPEGKTAKNRMHIDIRVAGKPPWDMAGVSGESLGWAGVCLHPCDQAAAEREHVRDCGAGRVAMERRSGGASG